ncbi:hypothetical protein D3C72_1737580 [compost metagenome]
MTERRQHRHCVRPLTHQPQIITVTRHAGIQQRLIVLLFRQWITANVSETAAERRHCPLAITGVHGKGQLTNTRIGIKTVAFTQQAQTVAHRSFRLGSLPL